MKTIKIIVLCIVALTTVSCHFDINLNRVNGNGDVQTQERTNISGFDRVKGSAGLEVILQQGTEQKVVVEADENLFDIIETYVEDDMLKITVDGNIGSSKAKRVYVTYTNLNEVRASSGASIIVKDQLKNENITLDASSGSSLEASVFAKELYLEASSGANLEISGKSKNVKAKASSGGSIDAENVLAARCDARASSGATITVQVKDHLEAKASSGGNIDYYGDPTIKTQSKNYSGAVNKM